MDIDDLVQREISEAQAVSTGHFTLSLERMLTMSTRFREKERHGWLARIVQASVASKATQLEINHQHVFYFEPEQPPSLAEIERILLNPQEKVSNWLEHLRRALWCLGWIEHGSFTIQMRGDTQQLTCRNGKFFHQPCASEKTFIRVELPENSSKEHWRTMLEFYTHCSPIPIIAGERRLDALDSILKEPMALGCLPERDSPSLQMPSGSNFGPRGIYVLRQPGQPRSGSVLWILARCQSSILRWVDDGVVVDSDELWPDDLETPPLHVVAYASAEGLPRDASGYQLLDGPLRSKRRREVLRALGEEMKNLRLRYQESIPLSSTPLGTGLATAAATTAFGWLVGDLILGGFISLFTGTLAWALKRGSEPENSWDNSLFAKREIDYNDLSKLKRAIKQWERQKSP